MEIAVWEVYDIAPVLAHAEDETEDVAADLAEEVRSLCVETVAPDTWAESGGFGQCRVFDRKLVVFNTPENLDQLATLLDQLHESVRNRELRRLLRRLEGKGDE